MREIYGFNTIVADTFRLDLVKTALEAEGFILLYIRNPKAIHSLLAPRVETLFANNRIIFGDNPLMRWYTNNVYVHIKKDGNKEYLKKMNLSAKQMDSKPLSMHYGKRITFLWMNSTLC